MAEKFIRTGRGGKKKGQTENRAVDFFGFCLVIYSDFGFLPHVYVAGA